MISVSHIHLSFASTLHVEVLGLAIATIGYSKIELDQIGEVE
jgi:hypothetical protein